MKAKLRSSDVISARSKDNHVENTSSDAGEGSTNAPSKDEVKVPIHNRFSKEDSADSSDR